MKLETKITERDKKLLIFLAVFLLVVGLLVLVIMPFSDTASALREEIAASSQSKEEMEGKIAALPGLLQRKEELQEEWEHVSRGLYPMLETQDIDKIVTDEVLAQGLTTKSLKISQNQDPVSLEKYLAQESGEDQSQDAAGGGDAQDAQSQDAAGDGDTQDAQPQDAAGDGDAHPQETAGDEAGSFGIYTAAVSLSVEGNRTNIRSLTDRFANDYLAVRVVSMKYDTKEVIDEKGLVQSLSTVLDMELEFYMCEK